MGGSISGEFDDRRFWLGKVGEEVTEFEGTREGEWLLGE